MKIIIIGGVAAGAKVAAKSKRLLPEADVHIYTQDTHVSYSECGLPYYIAGDFADWEKLIVPPKLQYPTLQEALNHVMPNGKYKDQQIENQKQDRPTPLHLPHPSVR